MQTETAENAFTALPPSTGHEKSQTYAEATMVAPLLKLSPRKHTTSPLLTATTPRQENCLTSENETAGDTARPSTRYGGGRGGKTNPDLGKYRIAISSQLQQTKRKQKKREYR
jgi:hypothetical protein